MAINSKFIPAWRGSGAPLILSPGEHWQPPVTVLVDAGAGSVQIQVPDSTYTGNDDPAAAAGWVTPPGADFSRVTDGPVRLARGNSPAVRIVATGDAKFAILGG